MEITAISIERFKNLHDVSLIPHPSYNLILGENAQGKTNILEALWALTGCKSFRGTREKDYIPFEDSHVLVEAAFRDERREQKLSFSMVKSNKAEKKYRCNDVERKSSELFAMFHCVVFTPEDLALVTGGPEGRRNFLDLNNAQLHPQVLPLVRRYQLVLGQRNALLKQHQEESYEKMLLQPWNQQLAALGTELSRVRADYVRQLTEAVVPLYERISGGRECLTLEYHSNVFGKMAQEKIPQMEKNEMEEQFLRKLEETAQAQRVFGHTVAGCHRDDLELYLDGKNAKDFGSQGQKKSIALALKLAQAEIYAEKQQQAPIILLDDVMGELDFRRQAVVSEIVKDMQVFVTTCHAEKTENAGRGKTFWVQDGSVTER